MSGVEIDRLALEVPGLPAEQGRRLAELIAVGLAQARWASAPSIDRLNVTVSSWPSEGSLEQLAGSIVAELRRRVTERG
jgi:hypothetical protein